MEKKLIYFIWDSKDINRMKRILKELGTNEDIIEQLVDLDPRDGTAVVPYTNGYSTYFGFDLDESEYELYKEKECKCEKCKKVTKESEEVTEVDIDEALDEYELTEDPDEAYEEYAKVDPEYDDTLEDLRVLLHVRDEYRMAEVDAMETAIGGFKEGDWVSLDYSILSSEEGFEVVETEYPSIFSFATEKMANKFLDDFEEMLTSVCDDLGYLM